MKDGYHTGQLGKWLKEKFDNEFALYPYKPYYDHGDPSSPNVVAVKALFGESVNNQTRLADIDLLVATLDNRAVLLVEIEESGNEPKKLLGDVFALLFCDRIAIGQGKQKYFTLSQETQIIIAGKANTDGKKLVQIDETITPRLRQFTAPSDGIPTHNVHFVFESDIATTIEVLKVKIPALLRQMGSRVST